MKQSDPVSNIPENLIQKEIEKQDERNKKQEKRVRNLETKAIQVANLYFVFQGIILASTSTASNLSCHNWWIPFLLSLFAAILNLFAFFAAMSNVLKSREELDQNLADLAFMRLYKITRAQLHQLLPGTPLNQPQPVATLPGRGSEIVRPKPGSARRWKRRLLAYLSTGLFIGFTAVIMYGCFSILCHSSNSDKCVKPR